MRKDDTYNSRNGPNLLSEGECDTPSCASMLSRTWVSLTIFLKVDT